MNKKQYLDILSEGLLKLPFPERRDIIYYYNEYFEEAGIDNEGSVIEELGSPEKLAKKILSDFQIKETGEQATASVTASTASAAAAPNVSGTASNAALNSAKTSAESSPKQDKKGMNKILLGFLLICSLPISLPLLITVFSLIFAAFMVALSIGITFAAVFGALFLGGLAMLIAGTAVIFGHFGTGILFIGLGLISVGLFCCILLPGLSLIGAFFRWLGSVCRSIFSRFKTRSA